VAFVGAEKFSGIYITFYIAKDKSTCMSLQIQPFIDKKQSYRFKQSKWSNRFLSGRWLHQPSFV